MTIYEAINRMRQLSAKKQPFAFSYMTYSLTRRTSHGERTVEHALLQKNAKESPNSYQDHMLTYLDTDTGEVHQCWQPLIMTFDHRLLSGFQPATPASRSSDSPAPRPSEGPAPRPSEGPAPRFSVSGGCAAASDSPAPRPSEGPAPRFSVSGGCAAASQSAASQFPASQSPVPSSPVTHQSSPNPQS